MTMLAFIRSIPEFGITPETPVTQANHYRLTNVLLSLLLIGSIFYTAALFLMGATQAAWINCSAPFVFGGGLWLMKKGHTMLARLFVITIAFSAGYVICTIVGRESYFQLIFLFASAFSVIFFSREEKWLLIYGLLTAIIPYVALEITDYKPVLGFQQIDIDPTELMWMRIISSVVIWALMIGQFSYFVKRRRQSQEQLVSSSKMVAMGRMAAGIAHEVNNPLQRIVGHADRLKFMAASGSVSPDQISQLSEQIQVVAMRIASIVKGLLALSRDASNDPLVEIPLTNVLRLSFDYCRARLESHDVRLVISDFPSEWTVIGRETQLSEVVLNVLSNAFDAVIDQTERWIRVDVVAQDANFIELAVTDSGPGVKDEIKQKIFDPFFTTKPIGKGTGLGLSVSQGIMIAHGGSLRLDSSSERTRFVLKIPRGVNMERPTIRSVHA